MRTYIGRQPIFDRNFETFAYELLYRSCDINNSATVGDNTKATARVIINLIQNLGVKNIIGSKIGFVNVDDTMLFSDAVLLLPKEHFYFEILEYTKVSMALCERVKHLHALGYRFLLDDFDCTDETIKKYTPLFPYIEIIKVDILAIGLPNLSSALERIEKFNIALLAEKIESFEEFQVCANFSFSYFQGYFFEKPLILSGTRIEPNVMNAIRMINSIQTTEDTKEISQHFSTCPDLVCNLLRHINSGHYHFNQTITNIPQMLTLLGRERLISWLGLFLYETSIPKPFAEELCNAAKFRAKFMESLAQKCMGEDVINKAFLTGSLSLINSYLNVAMETFLDEINLHQEIHDALLEGSGELGKLLWLAKEMEHSNDVDIILEEVKPSACFSKEALYKACYEANLFVEQSKQQKI